MVGIELDSLRPSPLAPAFDNGQPQPGDAGARSRSPSEDATAEASQSPALGSHLPRAGIAPPFAGDALWQGETQLRRKDGEWFYALESIYPLLDTDGRSTRWVHFLQDVSGHKLAEAVRRLAFYDTLTGLPNRNLLDDRLAHAWANAQRSAAAFALLYIDIDQFKQVNDTLGHEAGDELLLALGTRLASCLRESDTLARVGGDEFVVLLEHVREAQTPARVAEKLVAACRRPFSLKSGPLRVTVSIGVARYPEDGNDPPALLRAADQAMYQAKAAGGDAYRSSGAAGAASPPPARAPLAPYLAFGAE